MDTIETLNPEPPKERNIITTGFAILGISLTLFGLTMNESVRYTDIFNGSFMICGILFLTFFFVVIGANLSKYGKRLRFKNLKYNILLLQLMNVSAYALNRIIPVFNISTDWLCIYLVLTNAAFIAFVLRDEHKPNRLNHAIVLLLSSAIVFHLYETIYIFPAMVFAVPTFWFFGIPLHAFVPLWFFITAIIIVRKYLKTSPDYWITTVAGILIPIICAAFFCIRWTNVNKQITETFHSQNTPLNEQELPDWLYVSQNLRKDIVTKKILKSDLVYNTSGMWSDPFRGGFGAIKFQLDCRGE